MRSMQCLAKDCEKPARSKGLCSACHSAQARGKKVDAPKVCKTQRCYEPVMAKGFCSSHYKRHLRGQDTSTPIKTRKLEEIRRKRDEVMDGREEEFARMLADAEDAIMYQVKRQWKTVPESFKDFLDFDDLRQETLLYVWKNAWRYDPEKAAFTTFAVHLARSAITHWRTALEGPTRRPAYSLVKYDDPNLREGFRKQLGLDLPRMQA